MMNYPQGNNSSSSDEDQADAAYYGTQPTGLKEEHEDRHCKYERHYVTINDRRVYVHIRVCKCSRYTNRAYLTQGYMDLQEMDGKEIHYSSVCKWKRNKIQERGQKIYVLRAFCNGCIHPLTNNSAHSMNRVQETCTTT